MELTDLRIFLRIAEEGNITRAAEQLGYVQSNVTARIRKLEGELGVHLFNRHSSGVSLTEKGKTFREYACSIVNLSEEAVKAVQGTPYPSGSLRIGVVDTVHCVNFIQSLSDYQTMYPEVHLSLGTGSSEELISQVLNYQLDGAFVIGDITAPKLVADYVEQDEVKLLTKSKEVPFPDLISAKWAVSPEGCPFRNALESWLLSEGIPLNHMIEISSLDTLLGIVRSGLAVTLLPSSVLSGECADLGSFPIPAPFNYTTTSLIRRNDRFRNHAYSAFADLIKVNFERKVSPSL
ncbi:LysR family transcriptional regulator [Paenibacillus sp. JCM 10914]|uniref:LysR family transcriptional regulator n=1 Tax=Paenibacillus sp. JCM 10914 TaxID=1236974 RepID=UPI0003CCAAE4|nr:LysR family transcriptional regulator [Paenibacillus sp. JCM 10914]GAE06929.1 transcriptional regulator [Paenibacillus sp. JCM 10914]